MGPSIEPMMVVLLTWNQTRPTMSFTWMFELTFNLKKKLAIKFATQKIG